MPKPKPKPSDAIFAMGDAVYAPLNVHSHEWMDPAWIHSHPALQFRDGADPDTGVLYELDDEKKGLYDVDKGGCLTCWRNMGGDTYVVDGHHRLNLAKNAKHFASSTLSKGKHIPVDRKLPIRVLHEKDGWTPELARRQGQSLNEGTRGVKVSPGKTSEEERDLMSRSDCGCGGTCGGCNGGDVFESKAQQAYLEIHHPEIAKEFAEHTSKEEYKKLPEHVEKPEGDISSDEVVEEVCIDSYEVLAADSRPGVLCRLRQKATRVNVRNKNRRLYPSEVVVDAKNRALPFIRGHMMLSEFEHPRPVSVCDANGCEEKFPDNLERKTAIVDDLEGPDKDGWVYVVRSISDTPFGRIIHERVKKREPVGISMRFKMRKDHAKSDSETTVASHIQILTFDDVKRPAVEGAGEYVVLADGIEEPMRPISQEDFLAIDEVDAYYATGANELEPEATPETLEEGLGDPTQLVSNNTSNPEVAPKTGPLVSDPKAEGDRDRGSVSVDDPSGASRKDQRSKSVEEPKIMKDILRLQRRFLSELKTGASEATLDSTNAEWAKAITTAWANAEDVREFVGAYQRVMSDAETAGYSGRKSGPYSAMGNELGDDPMGGWGKDANSGERPGEGGLLAMGTTDKPKMAMTTFAHADGADTERKAYLDSLMEKDKKEKAESARLVAVTDALKLVVAGEHPFNKLSEDIQRVVWDEITSQAHSAEQVSSLLDSKLALISKVASDATLSARGLAGLATGNTVLDPANLAAAAATAIVHEDIPGFSVVKKMLAYSDSIVDGMVSRDPIYDAMNPNDPGVKRNREFTLKLFEPTLRDMVKLRGGLSNAVDSWEIGSDSIEEDVEQHLLDTLGRTLSHANMDSLATTTSVLYNQPTILMYMAVQSFQDMRSAQFVKVFGPGANANAAMGTAGFQDFGSGIGSIFRIPYESYTNPAGTGFQLGTADGGLLTTEGSEIQAGSVNYSWRNFGPVDRAIASTMSLKGILTMGKGPLNLSVVTRNLLHMAARKCRTIDTANQNEMSDIAMEYGAVVVTNQAYTTGNSYLPDNSVYNSGGSITVNLNPTKTAATAVVASTDKYVTYGANVVGAIRLVTGGSATSAPYVGTNGYAPNPVVRPRTTPGLNEAGAATSTTTNPFTVSVPAAQVIGLYAGGPGGDNQIYNDGSGTTATFAVDWINGVLIFNAGSGVTGSAGVMTTSTTVTYSYATNFDYFVATEALATPLVPSGQSLPRYYDQLISQIDKTAGFMGMGSRFVKPDLAVMTLTASHFITTADIFYKLNSPDGTRLFPDETFYFERTGIRGARINAPWILADQQQTPTSATTTAILLTRARTSFYALDTPFFVSPPIYPQGSTPLPIAGSMFYGYERSVIGTIQSQDINGAVLNPVGRLILLF